jgi:LTXXQ motif family protein
MIAVTAQKEIGMRKNLLPALVLIGATLTGAGVVAVAAPPAPPEAPADMAGPHKDGPGHHRFMMRHHRNPGAHLDGRLAYLKAELKINPAQEGNWSDFAAAMRKSTAMLEESRPKMDRKDRAEPLAVPARFDLAEKRLTARLDALKTIKGPAKKLYDSLDDSQKKSADELLMGPRGMR